MLGVGEYIDVNVGTEMTFFVTSTPVGAGGNLGGLGGADSHCQRLASAVGAGGKAWRAYLSTTETAASKATNARDRIGTGPWYNAKEVLIARDLDAGACTASPRLMFTAMAK
jgi:hypothetical protein